MRKRFFLLAAIFATLVFTPSGLAEKHFLRALMDGEQADAGNGTGSAGTGAAVVTYDDVSGELTWSVSWQDLDGLAEAMHFHGPAVPGQNAGVTQGVGVAANPAVGSATITPAEGADLLAGMWYLNLHTSNVPSGEIRGQVLPADLGDDFSGDLSKWTASDRGLENNAPVGYDPADVSGGSLVLGGTTSTAFWYGNSIESNTNFDSRLATEIAVQRVSLTGSGTAWRSSLWVVGDDGHYMHYSHNVGESGWSFNARDDGGSGTLTPTGSGTNILSLDGLDTDGGSYQMGIIMEPGASVGEVIMRLLHDGVEVATHSFSNFPISFKVVLTGQARAAADTVSAEFDDLRVFQTAVDNLSPAFTSSMIEKPDATAGSPYAGDLSGDAEDPEGDPITFAKTAGPDWLTVEQDGTFSGTPTVADAGVNQFTVEVRDAGGSNSATLFFRVIDPNAKPPTEGLFGWWPLDDGADSIALDISGNNRHANITNVDTGGLPDNTSAWFDDPDCGTVLSFSGVDGSGAYAVVGSPPASGTLPVMSTADDSDFTWSFWAKSDQASNNDIILGNRYSWTGADFAPREFVKFTTNRFEWDTNAVVGPDYPNIPAGVWMHHVVVKDGTSLTYYRDAVAGETSIITAAPVNGQPIYFGGQGVENWRGYLSDIRMFTVALDANDVFSLFNSKGDTTAPVPFAITAITREPGTGDITLSWNSKSGAVYGLYLSTSMKESGTPGGWIELDDGIPAAGATTQFTIQAAIFPMLNTERRLFFQVRELP